MAALLFYAHDTTTVELYRIVERVCFTHKVEIGNGWVGSCGALEALWELPWALTDILLICIVLPFPLLPSMLQTEEYFSF